MTTFLQKARAALARDRELPVSTHAAKALRFAVASLTAPRRLRACSTVGDHPRTIGRPIVRNEGTIDIGREFYCACEPVPIELATGPNGRIELGDEIVLNYGTSIQAQSRVRLGAKTTVGPHTIIWDSDGGDDAAADIDVGDGVWLAARVTVLPGSRIGSGSVISAGSIVSGEIPPGVVAGGNPARVLRHIRRTP